MTTINATNLRKNLFEYLNQAIEHNDVINISTKTGNAVLLSEEDYSGLMETIYLFSNPKTAQDILEALAEPIEEGTEYVPGEEW